MKRADASKPLRVSVGHDSRISAQVLQDAVSRGIAGSGLDVVQYRLASTPAMFNSTLTEDKAFLCPVDGAIMITVIFLTTETGSNSSQMLVGLGRQISKTF
uniref:Alpha-D-phosphohexomutase alpha/beta/alpha domain-containing protein n=1 Tax=Salix viminalis TaxID=40686 RepID=A0A6N2LSV6_SALVM